MADFDPPFSSVGGVNRSPTTDEQSDGFTCGAADLTLFNRLFGRIEAEMKAIQDAGGIPGSEGDDTTVLQAIQALINAATGGGATSDYVLFSQATARLPIFPEAQTTDGKIAVSTPSTGTVRIPAGTSILHRGIRTFTTVQTDLSTTSSKTYHLRWQVAAGVGTFVLKDLADVGYNPTTASEDNSGFDSTYDDMLVARVVSNSSNVVTVTNLTNKDRLMLSAPMTATDMTAAGAQNARCTVSLSYNWARTPKNKAYSRVFIPVNEFQADRDELIFATLSDFPASRLNYLPATRYAMSFAYVLDSMSELPDLYASISA